MRRKRCPCKRWWPVAVAWIAAAAGGGRPDAAAQSPPDAPGLLAMAGLDPVPPAPVASDDPGEKPVVLAVTPAAEPVPALKYALLPRRSALESGNAALFYHRAMLILSERAAAETPAPKPADWKPITARIGEWAAAEDGAFPREEAGDLVRALQASVVDEIRLGSRQASADWGLNGRSHQISLLLPDIQNVRSLGRLVAVQVRVETLDGRFDAALADLQVGYALARHVGTDSSLMIQSLVGIAIAGQMNQRLEGVIRAPGSPNLYWMLANRPRPLIGMATGIEGERDLLESELPALRTVEGPTWSLDESRTFADDLMRLMGSVGGAGTPGPVPADRASVAAMVAMTYPRARQALIDRGRTAEQVDAMPTLQVAALDAYRRYQDFRDDLSKQARLPYWQAAPVAKAAESRRFGDLAGKLQDPLAALFQTLQPAVTAALAADVRTERQLDTLQAIEALRLYAAGHGGTLPASLADLNGLAPAPLDPATGQPFGYRREGDTAALLTAPTIPGGPDHPTYRINYRIEIRPASAPKTETTQP